MDTDPTPSTELALVEPSQLVGSDRIEGHCSMVISWCYESEDIDAIREVKAKMEALRLYLEARSAGGRYVVGGAILAIDRRMGALLGPAKRIGARARSSTDETSSPVVSKVERARLRKIDKHYDAVIADVMADSSDEDPPTRAKLMRFIEPKAPTKKRKPKANRADITKDAETVAAVCARIFVDHPLSDIRGNREALDYLAKAASSLNMALDATGEPTPRQHPGPKRKHAKMLENVNVGLAGFVGAFEGMRALDLTPQEATDALIDLGDNIDGLDRIMDLVVASLGPPSPIAPDRGA